MAEQRNGLKQCLLELLELKTTPEQALQLMSYSCFSPGAYRRGNNEPVAIFMAYMRFIKTRKPYGCIDGIWEEILRKTVIYSRNFSSSGNDIHFERRWGTHSCISVVPEIGRINLWLDTALSSPSKCPNPYIRLELFRLVRIFRRKGRSMSWKNLTSTFIQTICEIQPHRLYPSGGMDDDLFNVTDLKFIVAALYFKDIVDLYDYDLELEAPINRGILKQVSKNKEVLLNDNEALFISKCIQLVGVFSIMANSIPDPTKHITQIRNCCNVFRETIGNLLVNRGVFSQKSPWCQFQSVVSGPQFRPYIVEAVCDLTAAIINNKRGDEMKTESLLILRNTIARDLDVWTKTCNLPRLLLSREVNGPTPVHKELSMLKDLHILFSGVDKEYSTNTYWSEIRIYNEFHNSDSDSDGDSDNESDESDE